MMMDAFVTAFAILKGEIRIENEMEMKLENKIDLLIDLKNFKT